MIGYYCMVAFWTDSLVCMALDRRIRASSTSTAWRAYSYSFLDRERSMSDAFRRGVFRYNDGLPNRYRRVKLMAIHLLGP